MNEIPAEVMDEIYPEIWPDNDYLAELQVEADQENVAGYRYFDKNNEHRHMFDGKQLTGVSTVTKVIAKDLTWWAAGKSLELLGWRNPKLESKENRLNVATAFKLVIESMSVEEYVKLLDKAYRAHDSEKDKAATKGTDMHSLLEEYVKSCIEKGDVAEINEDTAVGVFSKWSKEHVEKFIGSEVNCYSERLWLGGITDCIAELKDGTVAVIDFKSAKMAYPSHFIQVAGYDVLLQGGGFTPEGEQILPPQKIDVHIVFPFGSKHPTGARRYDVEKNREAFMGVLTAYRQIEKLKIK
jgi:hypothetical protein